VICIAGCVCATAWVDGTAGHSLSKSTRHQIEFRLGKCEIELDAMATNSGVFDQQMLCAHPL
jgi:hypothetical protein